jgi:hypothetical protein
MWRVATAVAVVGATLWGGAATASPTETCVKVHAATDVEALRKLVAVELDRHPTHRSTEGACQSHLRVELLTIGSERYVTVRINSQVPHREQVREDLATAVADALTVILHNDPVRLRGPRNPNWMRRQLDALRQGRTAAGAEIYQVGLWHEGEVQSLPGVALTVRRELADWQLGARLGFATALGDTTGQAVARHGLLQLGVNWYFGDGDVATYVGTLAGMDYQQFEGVSAFDGRQKTYSKVGFAVGGRFGVELLRTTRGRLDLFGQVVLPAFSSTDEDEGVVDGWFPTGSLGVGMLF